MPTKVRIWATDHGDVVPPPGGHVGDEAAVRHGGVLALHGVGAAQKPRNAAMATRPCLISAWRR